MIFSIHHEFMTKQHNFWTDVKDNTTQQLQEDTYSKHIWLYPKAPIFQTQSRSSSFILKRKPSH